MKFKFYFPLLVIVTGMGFCVYLQSLIPDGIYFNGDAGLKALLAKQLSLGNWRFDLTPPSETWVTDLWNKGLYPYLEPFVYQVNGKYFITFPFTFPLITSPFYALLGYRGLYIVQILALWGIWLTFYWLGRRLKLSTDVISLGLIILIFGSSLTLYSAMYWEHTLAVFLSFLGISLILRLSEKNVLSYWRIILGGMCLGLSVWFRPEFLCFNTLVILLILSIPFISQTIRPLSNQLNYLTLSLAQKSTLILSLVLTIALFFLGNQLIYGHPMGIHAIQIVEQTSLRDRLRDFKVNLEGLTITFLLYFPIILFSFYHLITTFWLKRKVDSFTLFIYLICLLFIIGVALIVPTGTAGLIPGGKQWGTRFLLILLPILSLVITNHLNHLLNYGSRITKWLGIGIFSFLLIISIHKNTFQGIAYLQKTHQGIKPVLEILEQSSPIIAISDQFVGQALEASLNKKYFFKVTKPEQLKQLSLAALAQGYTEFIYVCYPFAPCKLIQENRFPLEFTNPRNKILIQVKPLNNIGKYPLYQVKVNS